MKNVSYWFVAILGLGLLLYLYTQSEDAEPRFNKDIVTEKSYLISKEVFEPKKNSCENFYNSTDDSFSQNFIEKIKLVLLTNVSLADFILYTSNVDIVKGRKAFGLMKSLDTDKPKYYEGIAKRASNQKEKSIFSWVFSGEVEKLINAIYEYEVISEEYYRYKGRYVFLIELVLLSDLPEKEKVIRNLISAGIEPNLSDFIAAIKKGVSVELIDDMLIDSNIDPRKELNNKFHYRSLVTYAIYEQKYDLFKYWIKKGSPAEPDLYVANSLDILGFRNDKFTQKQRDDIYVTLINDGVYPNKDDSYYKLSQVLSDKTLKKHYIPKRNALYDIDTKTFMDEEWKLYSKIMKKLDNSKFNELSDPDCFRKYTRELVKSFVDSRIEPVKSTNSQLASANDDLDKIIEEASRFVSNEKDLISYLGRNQTLSDKKLVEYYLHKKAVNELDEIINNSSPDSDILELKDKLELVYKLAKNGEWTRARTLLSTLNVDKKEALSTLMIFALNFKAESKIVRGLLEDGAHFESALIYAIINTGDVSVADVFYENGLDVNYLDPNYNTPIMMAAKLQQYEMMKWLISKGSKINSHNLGFDALDIVLSSNMGIRRKIDFLTILINNGVLVEISHKQIVSRMFGNNLEEYYHIINKFPVFL